MDCYFGAYPLPEHNDLGKSALVLFHIPDLGIRFKAPFDAADPDHSDLAALLSLLEFIDSNQKYFKNQTFQLYGNNLTLINQVNGREISPERFRHLMDKANEYRRKYRFAIEWIPAKDNPAFDSLLD
jgi:hypothetical protein